MNSAQKRVNKALEYIEKNLNGSIDMQQLRRIAGCSEYHFRRMFSFLAGMSLGEYIRKRRLSQAGLILSSGRGSVLELALACGYESAEAFGKAFQAMHGTSPVKAKKRLGALQVFPPITFKLTISGGSAMEYRITEKDAFRIIGFKKRITLQFEGINPQMDSVAQKLVPEIVAELKALSDTEPKGILSVSDNFAERTAEGTELDQYIGVASRQAPPAGYDSLEVAPLTWAVFDVSGIFPDAVQKTWAQIFTEWLPASDYELAAGPEILRHESPDFSKPDHKSQIWIPLQIRGRSPL